MAAGRVDVPRGRGFHGSSLRGCDRHVSNTSVVGWKRVGGDQGVVIRQNGSYVSAGVRRLDIRRSGFSCRDEEREPGELCSRNGLLLSGDYEDGEIPTLVDDGVQLPPEKKRKFSPIIWDLGEKKVRASSNDLVAKAKAPVSPTASLRRSDANTNVAKSADSESQVSKVELGPFEDHVRQGSPDAVLPEGMHGFSDQELCQEEGEFAQARNLYRSRWASDDDSPMDTSVGDDKDLPGEGVQSRKVSPDKVDGGEEASDGSRSRSVGSCDRGYSVGSSSGDEELESELDKCDCRGADESQDGSICVEMRECDNNYRSVNMFEGCRSVFEYEKLNGISEGTYGKVYRARNKRTGEIVALKKVKLNIGRDRVLEEYGFPLTALREINILMSLYHPSIVNVKEVVMGGLDDVFMVMECMDHDLKGVMEVMKQPYSTSEVKCLMFQLLQGVKYLHDNWVLHRDLKTSNLLLNNKGELKICDFGMSRQYGSPLQPYTSLVVTLWYRAPELLLGTKQYSAALDMWSVGCIMAELLLKEPLFPGKTEIDQLDKIFRILGTPNEKIWPELSTLPGAKAKFVQQPYNLLRKKFPVTSFTGSPVLSDLGFDLLTKLLTYDPEKRISAEAALNHPWFHEVPLPKAKEFMPTFPPQSARTR